MEINEKEYYAKRVAIFKSEQVLKGRIIFLGGTTSGDRVAA